MLGIDRFNCFKWLPPNDGSLRGAVTGRPLGNCSQSWRIKDISQRSHKLHPRDNSEPKQPVQERSPNTGYVSEGEAEVRDILYRAEREKEVTPVNPEVLVEEQIAEVLSGEAEVLKEHNVIG